MSKIYVSIFIIFLGAIALFATFNQEVTTIKIPFGETYEIPKVALLLLSSAVGALAILIIFAVRDTKKFLSNWQYQKRQKREEEIKELYSKALDSLLAQDQDQAKELLNSVLTKGPEHISALLRLGDIALAEEDFQKAADYYRKARDLDTQNLETLFSLVRLKERTDRWADALNYIDDILEIDEGNLSALYKKRTILEKQSRWDDLVSLQKIILKKEHTEKNRNRERNNLVGYKYEYGRQGLENGDLEKAKKAFRTVLRLEKDFIPATLGLAEVLLREGESEEAVNILEKSYEQTESLIILARLEDLLISLEEPDRLIRIYKNSLLRNPKDPLIKFLLGKLYYRLEMIDDAFDTLESIDTGGSAYPELHQLMGMLYLKRNRSERAAQEFKKALDLKMALRLPYACKECGHTSQEWSGRCENCKRWNTFQFSLDGSYKV